MSQGSPQKSLVEAMKEPGFYPNQPAEVTHKETHISHIFIAGELVYKVKKAVRFSFLDYSTLDKRQHFLHEEMRLNKRLASSVYLAVVPIAVGPLGWHLGSDGEVMEYALVMRRLPDNRMLPFLIETGQATPEMMGELAQVLAAFHRRAEKFEEIDVTTYPQVVEDEWYENLADLRPFTGRLIEQESSRVLEDFGTDFISEHRELFARRAAQGWIRDVHGDLHCEHVCFAPEAVQIFDCIEFSPELRRCDIASEVAFLLMDLEFRCSGKLAYAFLEQYLKLLQDPELPALLPFYKCYRAIVRGKVHALRSRGSSSVAARYFRLAERLTWDPEKPFLVMVCGLTGSGKSTLARELSERLGMPVISSDHLRKAMAGVTGSRQAAFGQDIYTPAMTEKTYVKIAGEAAKSLQAGTGAILDATFGQRSQRQKILQLAKDWQVPIVIVYCRASDETTKRRLGKRAAEGRDTSDGRWEIYTEQQHNFQPFEEVTVECFIELDTEAPVKILSRTCEKFFRSRFSGQKTWR